MDGLLIRGGTVVNADHARRADVLCAQGVIVNVRNGPDAQKLIDVKFPKLPEVERGIDADELEVIDGGDG